MLGTGKAAAAMAAAFRAHWGAPVRGTGRHALRPRLEARRELRGGIEVVEAGHPSPDGASLAAGARLLELARDAARDERLCCLISGGGSVARRRAAARVSRSSKSARRRIS